jgi:hypothetical protein
MSSKLLEALRKLDTTNDDHWTQDGLPRLDVLKTMTGENVTRSDIANVAKSFNRFNAVIKDEANTAKEPETTSETETVSNTSVEEDDTDVEAQIAEGNEVVTDNEGKTELQIAEAAMRKASVALSEARNVFEAKREVVDALRVRTAADVKAIPAHTAIKAYQRSQAVQRAKSAANVNALREVAKTMTASELAAFQNSSDTSTIL